MGYLKHIVALAAGVQAGKDIKNPHLTILPSLGWVLIAALPTYEPRHHPRLRHLEAGLDQCPTAQDANPGEGTPAGISRSGKPLRLGPALPPEANPIGSRLIELKHSRLVLPARANGPVST